MNDFCLMPINVPEPPPHTQIKIRCLTCKKAPVCNIKEDYLKTAYLIQQILGDPQEDREIIYCDEGFYGKDFEDEEEIAPSQIQVTLNDKEFTGELQSFKYINIDHVKFLYKIDGYLVVFNVKWSEEFSRYEISDGKEIYYGVIFKVKSSTFDDTALQLWREEEIKKQEETENKDVINTTYFSADLNCDFYEINKCGTKNDKTCLGYDKEGNQGCYHHVSTYHIEPNKVPSLKPSYPPFPIFYPVYLPKKHCHKPPRPPYRRDDINE